jgi:hypothetical protein
MCLGLRQETKVFWFFSSEKNCFLKVLFLLTYFSDGLLEAAWNICRVIEHAEHNRRRGGGVAKPVAPGMGPSAARLCKRRVRPWGRNAPVSGNCSTRLDNGAGKVANRLGPLLGREVLAQGCNLFEGFGGEGYAGDACRAAIWRSNSSASASISRQRASVSIV